MASQCFSKALRAASRQKFPSHSFRCRTLTSSLGARPGVAVGPRATFAGPIQQQVRGVKTIDFAGHKEQVFGQSASLDYVAAILTILEREDWPREKLLVRLSPSRSLSYLKLTDLAGILQE